MGKNIYSTYKLWRIYIQNRLNTPIDQLKKEGDNSIEIGARNLKRNLTKDDISVDSKPAKEDSISTGIAEMKTEVVLCWQRHR